MQKGAPLGEVFGDLAFGGAVDARVGDGFFPMGEVGSLGGETLEVVAFERAVFDMADAAFDFALVLRRVGTAWHDARAVVLAEGLELGIDLGIEPVGAQHGGFEIVDIEDLGHAPKCRKAFSRQRKKVSVFWLSTAFEAGLSVGGPPVTSAVKFDEESQPSFCDRLA